MDLFYARIQFSKELTFVLVDTFSEIGDIRSEIQHLYLIVKRTTDNSEQAGSWHQ